MGSGLIISGLRVYANTVNDVAGGCEVGLVSGMLCFQVQLTMLNMFARSARVRKYTFTENDEPHPRASCPSEDESDQRLPQ